MIDTLFLNRKIFTDKSTIGELQLDGEPFCQTLEDTCRRIKVPRLTAIPSGRYQLAILPSGRYGRQMPRLLNVPGYKGILIHWGNYPTDTEGCILVGKYDPKVPDFVGHSRDTFNALFEKLQEKTGEMWISINGGFSHDAEVEF